jgi:hypothetical protein
MRLVRSIICVGAIEHPLLAEYRTVHSNLMVASDSFLNPERGANGLTIAKNLDGSESLAFIEAQGKQQ